MRLIFWRSPITSKTLIYNFHSLSSNLHLHFDTFWYSRNYEPWFTTIYHDSSWFASVFASKKHNKNHRNSGEFPTVDLRGFPCDLTRCHCVARSFWSSWTCRSFGRRWSAGVSWPELTLAFFWHFGRWTRGCLSVSLSVSSSDL